MKYEFRNYQNTCLVFSFSSCFGTLWSVCKMVSCDYNFHNPGGLCFLVQIKDFLLKSY